MSRPATARLFFALELPLPLREALAAWALEASRDAAAADRSEREQARRAPSGGRGAPVAHRGQHPEVGAGRRLAARRRSKQLSMRLIEAESMHLTLSFMGSVPVEHVDPLASVVASLQLSQGGEAALGAPLWLPTRRPRALAVEVHDLSGAIADAQRLLLDSLHTSGLARRDPSHGGAGRRRPLRPHVTVARLRAGAAPGQRTLPPTPQRTFPIGAVLLYRSWLTVDGASYEALAASARPEGRSVRGGA